MRPRPSRLELSVMTKFTPMLLLLWGAFATVALTGCWQKPADRLIGRWQGKPQQAAEDELSTALEAFDFSISLHFVDARGVNLALGAGEDKQPRSGTWQIIEATPDRLTIEIDAAADAAASASEIRRFKIRFSPGNDDQFTLVEDGADPSHGAILFRRVDSP